MTGSGWSGGEQYNRTWRGGVIMPTYEYLCLSCKKRFSVIMTIREYEKGKTKCPKCGKGRVKQQVTPFMAQTSKKS
jgi:putative FmdB family regulatory protein